MPGHVPVQTKDAALAQGISRQARGQRDPVVRFFFLWTAYNALYFDYYLAEKSRSSRRAEGDIAAEFLQKAPAEALAALLGTRQVEYLANRRPFWDGHREWRSRIGNHTGVLNLYKSELEGRPVVAKLDWSGCKACLEANDHNGIREHAGQLARIVYTVRCNLFHGRKEFEEPLNAVLLENCCDIVQAMIGAVTEDDFK